MKKIININKEIVFPSMIGEITAISLDHELEFVDDFDINGKLFLSGKYKLTEASRIEEDFSYDIPVEIVLTDFIDKDTSKIDISDFSYDVVDNNKLVCDVEITIEGLEVIEEDNRECDDDPIEEKEFEIPTKPVEEVQTSRIDNTLDNEESSNLVEKDDDSTEENNNTNDSVFFNIDNSCETYGTFIVYMVRQNETINSIIEKYNTTIEEIEKYNDIKDISIGTKLIIPLLNDKD